ncbi:MAG: lipase family alpha/beta hydrolase [Granulosicoccus sp.]
MTVAPIKFNDVRQRFARRFESSARLNGVTADGLLLLDDASHLSESTFQQPDVDTLTPENATTPIMHTPTLIVPGLLGDSVRNLVAPLMCARKRLEALGYQVDIAWVNGRAGCERNAVLLREQILRVADQHGSAVNLIGYSKGCADCLHMLGSYPDTHKAVRSLVSLVGVVHGTPLAEDPSLWLRKLLQYFPVPGVPFGDGRAIVDMSYQVRQQWLADHALPSDIYMATIAAAPQRARISRVLRRSYDKLAVINPANGNDSQVIDVDSILPFGDLLAIVNADHWAVALPVKKRQPLIARVLVDKNDFPRDVLLHALIGHLHDVETKASGLMQASSE